MSNKYEIWKDIENYENLYQVSNFGNVRSIRSNILLKPNIKKNGYYRVSLSKNGIVKESNIHQLVANAFIQNTFSKPTINHKDLNKLNNHVENLEWATMKEQMIHMIENKPNYKQKLIKKISDLKKDSSFEFKRLEALKTCNRSKQIEYAKSKTGLKNNRAKLMLHLETGFCVGIVKDLAKLYNVTHTAICQSIKRKGHFKGFYQI
jgi:hypothetical protein